MRPFPLIPYPETVCEPVSGFSVQVEWSPDDLLTLRYHLEGHIDGLQLPAQRRPTHTDGLWRSTCFEAFIRPAGAHGYVELNFSPSTEWAVYQFDDYRRGIRAVAPQPAPRIVCRRQERGMGIDVEVWLTGFGFPATNELQLGLAAVLQERAGAISYWALTHPAGEPDFHHPGSFVLTLPRAETHDGVVVTRRPSRGSSDTIRSRHHGQRDP